MREPLYVVAVGFDDLLTGDTSNLSEVMIEKMLRHAALSVLRELRFGEGTDIPIAVSVVYDVATMPGVRVEFPRGTWEASKLRTIKSRLRERFISSLGLSMSRQLAVTITCSANGQAR